MDQRYFRLFLSPLPVRGRLSAYKGVCRPLAVDGTLRECFSIKTSNSDEPELCFSLIHLMAMGHRAIWCPGAALLVFLINIFLLYIILSKENPCVTNLTFRLNLSIWIPFRLICYRIKAYEFLYIIYTVYDRASRATWPRVKVLRLVQTKNNFQLRKTQSWDNTKERITRWRRHELHKRLLLAIKFGFCFYIL